jgi:YqxM protein
VGIVIRNKRLRKFRNKHWTYILCVKLTVIVLTTTFSLMSLIGTTNALFNDVETKSFSITTQWEVPPDEDEVWDRSSLKFIDPVTGDYKGITAIIKNVGDRDMAGTVVYEVYWIESGNPKNGEKVGGGIVPALGTGNSHELNYTPSKSGNYMFKAYQRPNHGDPNGTGKGGRNGNPENALWSAEITVIFPSLNVEQPDSGDGDTELPAEKPQQENEGNQEPNETEPNDELTTPNPESDLQEPPNEAEDNENSESTQQEPIEENPEDQPDSVTDTQ